MKYAIELYFDAATEQALDELTRRVADEGISTSFLAWQSRPHLTLACLDEVDESACIARLTDFARMYPPLPAHIGSLGMFPDTQTIFAAPIMTQAMYAFHARLHACLQGFDTAAYAWYTPDRWVPHCTLALTRDDPDAAFDRASYTLLHAFEKLSGQFTAIGLVRVTRPVQEVATIPLTGGNPL